MLISPEYLDQQRQMHSVGRYGDGGGTKAGAVRLMCYWGRRPILDYGCGKQGLADALGPAYRVTGYDPAIEGLDAPPDPHPVVVCSDVLEHIEPECLDDVLRDIRRVTQEKAVFFVSTVPAEKCLPDGRNAHLIVQPPAWWKARIAEAGLHIIRDGDGENDRGEVCGFWAEAIPC